MNRRDGLVVRRSIAKDFPLRSLGLKPDESVWAAVFRRLEDRKGDEHQARHGLFPRWLYETERRGAAVEHIRRRLFHYAGSRDRARYRRLRQDLALYRHVFGQANQEELLARLRQEAGTKPKIARLEPYMLNLAPFAPGYARTSARKEASRHLGTLDLPWLAQLIKDVRRQVAEHAGALGHRAVKAALRICDRIQLWVDGAGVNGAKPSKLVHDAVAALVYLRNPFDDRFDIHRTVGFKDDEKVLVAVARRLGGR